MTVISIEFSEEVAARLSALPEAERNHFTTQAVAQALAQREDERDAAECIAIVEASMIASDAGITISLDEEIARWEAGKEALIQQVRTNHPPHRNAAAE